jgi:hypothetical protein
LINILDMIAERVTGAMKGGMNAYEALGGIEYLVTHILQKEQETMDAHTEAQALRWDALQEARLEAVSAGWGHD